MFAPTKSALAGCGCIAGPIIIIATLLFTLTNWIDVIYDDPVRVALLQTAGLAPGRLAPPRRLRASVGKGSRRSPATGFMSTRCTCTRRTANR